MRLVTPHFHQLDNRLRHSLTREGIRLNPSKHMLDRRTVSLVRGILVDRKPLDPFLIALTIIEKNKAGHRSCQRITVLIHEPAVLIHIRIDAWNDEVVPQLGQILVGPGPRFIRAIGVAHQLRSRD